MNNLDKFILEKYCANVYSPLVQFRFRDCNQLKLAKRITNENEEYDQIDFPQNKYYRWISNEGNIINAETSD